MAVVFPASVTETDTSGNIAPSDYTLTVTAPFADLVPYAGGDTTRNLLSSGLVALFDNPDQLAWLKADLKAGVCDRGILHTSPVLAGARTSV